MCKEPTPWHGYNLQKGDIYGVDQIGPYITRPIMLNGSMAFKRPHVYNGVTLWETRRADEQTTPHVKMIQQRFKVQIPPALTKQGRAERRKLSADRAAKTHVIWRDAQASVIRKNHFRFKSRIHGNCKEYRDATLLAYGDTAEINGRCVPVTDKIGFYLDGGTIY